MESPEALPRKDGDLFDKMRDAVDHPLEESAGDSVPEAVPDFKPAGTGKAGNKMPATRTFETGASAMREWQARQEDIDDKRWHPKTK